MRFAKASILSLGAMVASGSALAADVITIPEPEPMEYVRVCDVYGAGFFYIPGTETCLRISGYVRYQIGATSDDGDPLVDTPNHFGFEPDGWDKTSRARVNFDARSETEWGTLRGYIRVQSTWTAAGVGDGPASFDQAWLSLGGFRAGYTDSAFESTMNGGESNGGSHSDDGMDYGDPQVQLIQYNFSANGFFATISLEDDGLFDLNDDGVLDTANYVPDVVGKVGYGGGWGAIWLAAAWDEDNTEIIDDPLTPAIEEGDSEFALKGGVHLNVPQTGGSLRVIGLYASGFNSYWDSSEWSVIASYGQDLTSNIFGSVGFQYFSDVAFVDGLDAFMVEGSLAWMPVENFEIRTEVNYAKIDGLDGTVAGYLRFQRDF